MAAATPVTPVPPTPSDVAFAETLCLRKIQGVFIEPADLAEVVASLGGINIVVGKKKWPAVRELLQLPFLSNSSYRLKEAWKFYFPKTDWLFSTTTKDDGGTLGCVVVWYCGLRYDWVLLFGIVWYCLVLFGVVWYCLVLFGIVWYCLVLFGIICLVLFGFCWFLLLL